MERVQKKFLKILSLSLATALMVPSAHSQDAEPDLRKEESFHRVYKKYNEQPTSAEAWEKALANRPANTYSVQNKDTLWDISGTLFGDSYYWPKVWSYNTDDILNPHEINPNQAIKFYPGTMAEAPTVGLANKGDAPEALPTHVLEKNEGGTLEGIKLPPAKKSVPVVKKLPKSLPLYRWSVVNKPKVDFEVSGQKIRYRDSEKFLGFYASDTQIPASGEIVEMDGPFEQTAGDFQYAVVRVSDPSQKKFLSIDDTQKLTGPSSNQGYVVEVQGEIEVMERVSDTDNLYRARVKRAINPVMVGAKLVPGSLSTFTTQAAPMSTSVQSEVIGGEYQKTKQKLFGTDNLIFLDAGAKQGLQLGSTLAIFKNERIRKSYTKSMVNDRSIGQVKVVKLSDNFATAYILDSHDEVTLGDYVGGATAAKGSSAAAGGDDLDIEAPSSESGDQVPPPELEDDLQL